MKFAIGTALALLCCICPAGVKPVFSPDSWGFSKGAEFPGAAGTLKAGSDGTLLLEGDFTGGGDYVAAKSTTLDFPAFRELRFKVRTDGERVALRYLDSAGQAHQLTSGKLSGKADADQEVVFRIDKPSKLHWGGPNDGVLHAPLRNFSLIIRKAWHPENLCKAEFRDIELAGTEPGTEIPIKLKNPPPATCFVSPHTSKTLQLTLQCGPQQPGRELGAYRFCDYTGKPVAEGEARFAPDTRSYAIPLPQETGFYQLDLPGFGKSHGIVISEPYAGTPDDFFGLDEPGSRSWKSESMMRSLMRISVRNGIIRHRDRIGWEELNPERGKFDFNARKGLYEMVHRLAAEEGMKIQDVTHDTPRWNKGLTDEKDHFIVGANTGKYSYGANVFPRDLIAAADGLSGIMRHWPVTEAFEVWNEPEIFFGNNFPPEFVTALTKAVSRRVDDERLTTKILGGTFATPTRKQMYQTYLANGLLDDCDALSWHTYHRADEEEAKVLRMRAEELQYAPGRAGIPYWITESGMPWHASGPRPELNEDRFSASEITAKAIEFRALGIEAYFPFKDTSYRESLSNFGMYGADVTPLRSLAAYSHLPGTLAHKRYIGDLALPGATRSRVFADGKETVACIYVPLDVKANMGRRRNLVPPKPLPIPAGLPVKRVEGIDGRALKVENNLLSVEDGMVYLYLGDCMEGFLKRI